MAGTSVPPARGALRHGGVDAALRRPLAVGPVTFAARSTTSLLNDNVKVQLDRYVAPPALTPFFAVVCCRFGFAVALIGSRRFSLLLLSAAPSFAFASASGRRSHRLADAQFA